VSRNLNQSTPETPTKTQDPLKPSLAKYIWLFGVVSAFSFVFLIWVLGPNLKHFTDNLIRRNDIWWYYWKLPTRDFWSMNIAWVMYIAHQISIWAIIYFAQKNRFGFRNTTLRGLSKYTLSAFTITITFVLLHIVQTQLWFDGLAQDVPILTSQGSVIVLLSIVLIIENQRRGLFLGRKAGRPFTANVAAFFRSAHKYIFAWALIYTFWFHPMATDPQLLSGFFYMFLLFTQLMLAWTPVHLDKRWIILLESYVAIHAVIVAAWNANFFGGAEMWPMFFTGFAFMFVFTYMYAFRVSRKIYGLVTVVYAAFLAWLYLPAPFGFGRSVINLTRLEFLWIPLILYGLAALFAVLAYLKTRK
jgi:hypothetical protein